MRLLKNKKGLETETLALLIIFVLFATALIIWWYPKIYLFFEESASQGKCQVSVAASGLTKSIALGKETIEINCPANRITINKTNLDPNYQKSKEAIQAWAKYDKYANTAPYFRKQGGQPQKELIYEHALDGVVAGEMKDCWEKVFKGKIPVFNQWWNLFGYEEESSFWEVWNIEKRGPPVFCIVCSRIKFNEKDMEAINLTKEITSLNEWMYNTPESAKTLIPYYDYIIDGQTPSALLTPEYIYDTREPYAVIYKRVNIHKLGEIIQGIASWLGYEPMEAASTLELVPYNKIKTSIQEGGAGCTPEVLID